ncbi:unnamed protein product [Polarella glacialis]|uniref:Uncharacterized protein n=2 Tax=Polarella glacialis TaxID=89957 RepID=A0A813F3R9_POLGL|nr:unnamed protein product [Polarella glacialis]
MPSADASAGADATALPSSDDKKTAQKSGKEMDNIMRKVNDLELCQNKLFAQKQAALELLVGFQGQFEEKDKELQDCLSNYNRVCKNLKEKSDKRNHLRDQVKQCNSSLTGINKILVNDSRRAAVSVKDLLGNYHSAERAAERGYSSKADPNAYNRNDATQLRRTMMGGFGSQSSPNLGASGAYGQSGQGDVATPSPMPS